jgi:hypothetical protein
MKRDDCRPSRCCSRSVDIIVAAGVGSCCCSSCCTATLGSCCCSTCGTAALGPAVVALAAQKGCLCAMLLMQHQHVGRVVLDRLVFSMCIVSCALSWALLKFPPAVAVIRSAACYMPLFTVLLHQCGMLIACIVVGVSQVPSCSGSQPVSHCLHAAHHSSCQ